MLFEVLFLLYISFLHYVFLYTYYVFTCTLYVFLKFCYIFLFWYYLILNLCDIVFFHYMYKIVIIFNDDYENKSFQWFEFFMFYKNFYWMTFTGYLTSKIWSLTYVQDIVKPELHYKINQMRLIWLILSIIFA